ncbi:MAG: CHAT domain-containing protein [Gloeotrichia echinulata CP02]
MARKWSLLFRSVESFLRLTSRILTILWRGWGYSRLVVVMLLGIFILTAGMPVVLSQMTGASQIAQSFGKKQKSGFQDIKNQIQEVKKLQNEGLYYTACKTLIATVLPFYAGLTCDDLEQKYWQEIKNKIDAQNNDTQVIIWFYFGEIMRVIGDLEKSEEALNKGLKVAKNLSSEQQAVIYLSLANTFRAKGNLERDRRSSPVYDYMPWQYVKREEIEEATEDYNKAQENYQIAIDYSSSSIFRFIVQVNLLSLLIERNQFREAQELSSQIYSQKSNISEIPENLKLKFIYAQINLAKSLAYLKQISEKPDKPADNPTINWDKIISLLRELQKEAKKIKINSKTAESYVLGNLGGMYEYLGKLNKAQKATEEALYLAQPSEASNIAYQWQWQMGRLLKQQGKIKEAIASYEAAVKTLESVRGDLLAINSDVQFSFRDNVEPLYRELVDILLSHFPNVADSFTHSIEVSQISEVPNSINYVDSLQLAELENFLRCSLSNKVIILDNKQNIYPTYPTIVPIIMKNQLAVTLSITDSVSNKNKIYFHQEAISSQIVEGTLETLRGDLKIPSKESKVQKSSEQIYNWLIKPFEEYLDVEAKFNDSKIKKLVFLLDGSFKNIPMSVLYNSEKKRYLIERFAVAVAPSLKLLELEPLPKNIHVLRGGLSLEVQHPFKPEKLTSLEGVRQELDGIKSSQLSGEELLDYKFTKENLETKIKTGKFSIIHLATHGEFSSDPNKTYILLSGKTSNKKSLNDSLVPETLYVKDLDNLLRTSQINTNRKTAIKLLVLSACETASGDKRAALGLSGLAIRAGARSTIASLWQADEEATPELMIKFYKQIKENNEISRADALRLAQLSLWESNEEWKIPRYWATFILVGNWL